MFPPFIATCGWGIWLLAIGFALYNTHQRWLKMQPVAIHLFFSSVIILTLFALMRVGTVEGLDIHLLGLTSATLMMRRDLALLAFTLSRLLLWILGKETLNQLGIDGVIEGIIPIYCSAAFAALLRRFLAPNPFVFTLGAGFFGGIISLGMMMLCTGILLWSLDLQTWEIVWTKYLQWIPVIIYPEGFLNGLFATVMVAFHPNLLSEFDPKRYFAEKKS